MKMHWTKPTTARVAAHFRVSRDSLDSSPYEVSRKDLEIIS